MGCDIHTTAERRVEGKWQEIEDLFPFDWRAYGMFGFLADVRNYSAVPPISAPRGTPEDSPSYDDDDDRHSHSWLSVEELCAFDYDQAMEDRRVSVTLPSGVVSGAGTCSPGEGRKMSFREFLGKAFFEDLAKLREAGAERVVFCFDS